MARRYLDASEVQSALQRGKSVECFLGACSHNGVAGIRWFSICAQSSGVAVSVFESADAGSEEFIDVYEFGPVDPTLELDEATEQMQFPDLAACLNVLAKRFPESTSRLVNQGLIQDEYADYVARGRK